MDVTAGVADAFRLNWDGTNYGIDEVLWDGEDVLFLVGFTERDPTLEEDSVVYYPTGLSDIKSAEGIPALPFQIAITE